jgi:ribosomal protein L34E
MKLRDDVKKQNGGGVVTSIKSLMREEHCGSEGRSEEGIKIHRTVEISRVEEEESSESGSERWHEIRTGRKERDMV